MLTGRQRIASVMSLRIRAHGAYGAVSAFGLSVAARSFTAALVNRLRTVCAPSVAVNSCWVNRKGVMMNDYEMYESACPECGEDSTNGRLCFSCQRQKAIDDYDFDGWQVCPECQSTLIMQHDWRKAVYVCQLCGVEFGNGEVLYDSEDE